MNILDGLIILFIIMGAFKGRRTGLAAIIGKFLSILAGIIMAIISYRPVAEFLDNRFRLNDTVYSFLEKRLNFAQGVGSVQIHDVPFASLAQYVVNAIAFLVVFFIFVWIFRWFFKARKSKKFSIIGGFNRLGGFLVGGAVSFLKITIAIVLMAPLVTFDFIGNNAGFLATLSKQIAGSLIANNIINLVAKIIS